MAWESFGVKPALTTTTTGPTKIKQYSNIMQEYQSLEGDMEGGV